jgi:DNA polymerase III delta subunit
MSSSNKWLPWDFVKVNPEVIDVAKPGIYALSCSDPYIERMIMKRIPRDKLHNGHFSVLAPNDFTVSWIEDNLQTLSLFGDNSSYLVLMAEKLEAATRDYLSAGKLSVDSRFLFLLFSEEAKFFNELEKANVATCLRVDTPRFWEGQKFVQFLADEMGLRLSYDVINSILEVTEAVGDKLVAALKLLAMEEGGRGLADARFARELLVPNKLDQFELASLYGRKERAKFFEILQNLAPDNDVLRGLFAFMQGHLLKVLDPSYIKKKPRPTKYDKEIEAQSRLWNGTELQEEIGFFARLEIEAKKRSPELKHQMKLRLYELRGA